MTRAYIRRTVDGRRSYWTGDEWIPETTDGWLSAGAYGTGEAAEHELDSHAGDDDFRRAEVVELDQ